MLSASDTAYSMSNTRGWSVLCAAAQGVVALLAILTYAVVQNALSKQSTDARIINIAGRQRMLSQRISKASLALHLATEPIERIRRRSELEQMLELWEWSHQGLQQGDPALGLPGKNSAASMELLQVIEPNFRTMLREAKGLMKGFTADGKQSMDDSVVRSALAAILAAESSFLQGMDKLVFQYDAEATGRVATLKQLSFILLLLTLVVLFFESLLVFRPLVGRLRVSSAALAQTQALLAHNLQEQAGALKQRLQQQNPSRVEQTPASAALIPISSDLLLMPIAGKIDQARGDALLQTLLHGITEQRARVIVLDLSRGSAGDDQELAKLLDKAVRAARLLGTRVILTGLGASLAHTLVQQDLNWQDLLTSSRSPQ